MSQRELARRADRHHDVVSRFARGDTTRVSFDLLASVCAALECQPGDVLRYTPDPEEQIPLFEGPSDAEMVNDEDLATVVGNPGGGARE